MRETEARSSDTLLSQFYRCFVALVKCGTVPHPNHTFNTQPSSGAEEQLANGIPLSQLEPDTPPRRSGPPYGTQIGAMEREKRAWVLVVHYTPQRAGQLVQ
ncbi:hypothetical protein AAFF_G00101620 [Aldrovandia affinis]|uniref:Uncharacterized protein n=1 Tax=Aldrovandia affinis TaxID=143900 RepID=A0AAD7RUB8_9TELE|nr:hypothetical protein AAFF_G00101620 [Aldrovandia affinis]